MSVNGFHSELAEPTTVTLATHSKGRLYFKICVDCRTDFSATGPAAKRCPECREKWKPQVSSEPRVSTSRDFPQPMTLEDLTKAFQTLASIGIKRLTVSAWDGGLIYRTARKATGVGSLCVMPNKTIGFVFAGISVEWGQL